MSSLLLPQVSLPPRYTPPPPPTHEYTQVYPRPPTAAKVQNSTFTALPAEGCVSTTTCLMIAEHRNSHFSFVLSFCFHSAHFDFSLVQTLNLCLEVYLFSLGVYAFFLIFRRWVRGRGARKNKNVFGQFYSFSMFLGILVPVEVNRQLFDFGRTTLALVR